jgi:hypothetical protein
MRQTEMPRQLSRVYTGLIGVIDRLPGADRTHTRNHIINNIDIIRRKYPYSGVVLLDEFETLGDKM